MGLILLVSIQEDLAGFEGRVPDAAEAQHDVPEEVHEQDGSEGTGERDGDGRRRCRWSR